MKIKKHQQGSVIIEVLVAAVIFLVAMFALLELQANLLQNRSLLSQQTEALQGAQNMMDSLRNYTSITSTPGQFAYDDITNGSQINTGLTATFTTNWYVTTATDTPARKNVRVVVTWTDSAGVAHTATNAGATNSAVYIDSIITQINPTDAGVAAQNLP